jgi:hypothetical protein
VPLRTLAATALLMLVVCACNKPQSAFQQEYRSVQKTLSGGAEPTRASRPRQNGYALEASLQYEFEGHKGAAMKAFQARIPAGYSLVRQTGSELSFARYDGHDSFYLTLTFDTTKQDSTTVQVQLRSLPD